MMEDLGPSCPRWFIVRAPRLPGVPPVAVVYTFKSDKLAQRYLEWERSMPRPRWHEYVRRWWLTLALPYREWRLPWRQQRTKQ